VQSAPAWALLFQSRAGIAFCSASAAAARSRGILEHRFDCRRCGEFFLRKLPNGGTAILIRSLWVTAFIYPAAVIFKGLPVLAPLPQVAHRQRGLWGLAKVMLSLVPVASTILFMVTTIRATSVSCIRSCEAR